MPAEHEFLRSYDRPASTWPAVIGAPLPPDPKRPQAEIDPVPLRLAKAVCVEKTATWPVVVGAPLPPNLERPQAEIDPGSSRLAKAYQVEKTATWPVVVGAPLPPYPK